MEEQFNIVSPNSAQLREIIIGQAEGIDTSVYDDVSKYNAEQMYQIRTAITQGLTIEEIAEFNNPKNTRQDMERIKHEIYCRTMRAGRRYF